MKTETYRERSSKVEAVKITTFDDAVKIASWCGGKIVYKLLRVHNWYLALPDPGAFSSRKRFADPGDYVVRFHDGRFGALTEKDFVEQYEQVTS